MDKIFNFHIEKPLIVAKNVMLVGMMVLISMGSLTLIPLLIGGENVGLKLILSGVIWAQWGFIFLIFLGKTQNKDRKMKTLKFQLWGFFCGVIAIPLWLSIKILNFLFFKEEIQ